MSGIFTIPASAPFGERLALGVLARIERDAFALSETIIYLPTRRAARTFGESFARVLGGSALLPQFRALGDSAEDELLFDAIEEGLELPPAISQIRRQLLLAALIRQWSARDGVAIGFAQAAALAESLAQVLDDAERQGADLSRLEDLAPLPLAAHWQEASRFLILVRDQWPALLAAEGAIDPVARRNLALALTAERLAKQPPAGLVIAAGSTGSIPATAGLLRVIAGLPQGALVLPGLDRELEEKSWQELDAGHPQYGLKQLLDLISAARSGVQDWHGGAPRSHARTSAGETLRPAPTTDARRALADVGDSSMAEGLDGLSLVTAADPAEEV